MSTVNITGQQLNDLLKVLERFGFKFYGYNESREPLVIAPNGQITSVRVAYSFVQNQVARAVGTGGNNKGPENINVPVSALEMFANNDAKFEKGNEKIDKKAEKGNEKRAEKSAESQPANNQANTASSSPSVVAVEPTLSKPYSFGFDPSFEYAKVKNTIEFINKNVKVKDDSKSVKWLAHQFQKWLEEFQSKMQN